MRRARILARCRTRLHPKSYRGCLRVVTKCLKLLHPSTTMQATLISLLHSNLNTCNKRQACHKIREASKMLINLTHESILKIPSSRSRRRAAAPPYSTIIKSTLKRLTQLLQSRVARSPPQSLPHPNNSSCSMQLAASPE